MKGIFITGTNTAVGKTYIGCLIAQALNRQGIRVTPRKPVESGCTQSNSGLIPADAKALLEASGYPGDLSEVCAYRFEAAISPARAAQLCNQSITIDQLTSHCLNRVDANEDFLLVEGAGGFYSPLCSDGLNADLAQSLALPVILVSNNTLGCINQVLLSAEAIKNRKLNLAAVILNQQGNEIADGSMDNLADLSALLDCPVLAYPDESQGQAVFIEQITRLLI